MSKVLILANDFSTIYNFRRELLKRLIEEEFEVTVSLPRDERNRVFREMGCKIEKARLSRAGTNPIRELLSVVEYIRLIRRIRPDVVLTYTAKPNVYGGLACQLCGIPYINNVTGLGSMFQSENFIKKIMLFLQKKAYRKSQSVFFQNSNNKRYFEELGIVGSNAALLPGSGVNLELHSYEAYPDVKDRVRFITVSRIRKDKGFDELFNAVSVICSRVDSAEFHIVGSVEDKDYRQKLADIQQHYPIIYHGAKVQEEVRDLIAHSHCLIHPSYHEGMANAILEAAATGRPCLASDIPGCKEAVENGTTGLLFEVRSSETLVEAIMQFLELPHEERAHMGLLGRKKMEAEFDRQIVVEAYLREIGRCTSQRVD